MLAHRVDTLLARLIDVACVIVLALFGFLAIMFLVVNLLITLRVIVCVCKRRNMAWSSMQLSYIYSKHTFMK